METKICSKCKRELPLTSYHKNGFNSQGRQQYRGYCKDCANNREKARYQEKKDYINQQKVCCEKCGDTRVWVLDFHHRDKDDKDFTIGALKKGSISVIQKEIEKCVVLCANCHREFHYLEREAGLSLEEYLSSRPTPSDTVNSL